MATNSKIIDAVLLFLVIIISLIRISNDKFFNFLFVNIFLRTDRHIFLQKYFWNIAIIGAEPEICSLDTMKNLRNNLWYKL